MTAISGKVIWITGASSGIGESLALAAAAQGARLVLTARRTGELERVRQACPRPDEVCVLPADLMDFDAPALAAQAAAAFGPIDILVNNAGRSQRGRFADTDLSVYRQLLELDFFAPLKLTQAVLPQMRGRGGHVVMIGSVLSRLGTPLRSGYAAAKHALAGFTEAVAAELWHEQVRFTLVLPGYIRTQVSVNAVNADGTPFGAMDSNTAAGMAPERCARKIWRAVERNREELLVGWKEGMFVYLKRWFPGVVAAGLKRVKVA